VIERSSELTGNGKRNTAGLKEILIYLEPFGNADLFGTVRAEPVEALENRRIARRQAQGERNKSAFP
jgi:hypothetical protein